MGEDTKLNCPSCDRLKREVEELDKENDKLRIGSQFAMGCNHEKEIQSLKKSLDQMTEQWRNAEDANIKATEKIAEYHDAYEEKKHKLQEAVELIKIIAEYQKMPRAIEEVIKIIRKAEDEAIEKCAKVADMCELGNGDIAEEIAIRIRKLKYINKEVSK